MNEILLLSVAIASSFVRKNERVGAIFFGLLSSLFYVYGEFTNDGFYYILAMIFDCIMCGIFLALHCYTQDKLTKILFFVECLSILINAYGFSAFLNYKEPHIYNSLFDYFYLSIIILFIARSLPHGGTNRLPFGSIVDDSVYSEHSLLRTEGKS